MVQVTVTNFADGTDFTLRGDFQAVGQLKSAIHQHCGMSELFQILVYDDVLLNYDHWKLDEDYEFEDMDSIDLHQRMMPQVIIVGFMWKGLGYMVTISSTDQVCEVKSRFERECGGLPPHRQRLTCMEADMYDHERLDEYAIDGEVTIYVMEIPPNPHQMMTLNVIVLCTGQVSEFRVEERDSMYTLYGMVKRAGLADGGDWYFVQGDQRIEKNQTVGNLNVCDGEVLYLKFN